MAQTTPLLNLLVLDTHSTQTIGVGDMSFYPPGFIIINPTIEITPPSFPKQTIPFSNGQLAIYNSTSLGMLCPTTGTPTLIDLPDGIWTLKYSISPANVYIFQKTFLRTELIQQKFGTAFLLTDMKQCDYNVREADMRQLDQAWYLINGAIADANNCNVNASMKKYQLADKMLTNFIKQKT